MEECRHPVLKSFSIPDSLPHGLRYIQPLHAFNLNVNAWQPYHIRHGPERFRPAALRLESVLIQDGNKLPLAAGAFPL